MVELKKKVTLKKKVSEVTATKAPLKPKKNKIWIWIVLLLVVLSVATYFIIKPENTETIQNDELIETPAIVEEPSDEISKDVPSDTTSAENANDDNTSDKVKETTHPQVDEKSESEVLLSEDSIETKAKQVIRGDFGNGLERKNNLGSEYKTIQNRVNQMYKEGLVD